MQLMLDTCQRVAAKYNLQFSTDPNPEKSKTECIFVCGLAKPRKKPDKLILDGKQLPWVESAHHLGHILHQSGTMQKDISVKKATFIDNSVEVRETFGFASPSEILQAVKLYMGSHYGSMLWELDSDMATKYFNAWTICVKLAWQVPTIEQWHHKCQDGHPGQVHKVCEGADGKSIPRGGRHVCCGCQA